MIISASRRTDLPALYPEWLMNRLRAGEVLVPNPYNRKKVSRVELSPDTVDCLVFWTKNPDPLVPYLKEIDDMGYPYYFEVTITDYAKDMEPNVPSTEEMMASFILLSEKIGKERMDLRFDPIILSEEYSLAYHVERFETMCKWLHNYTERCIISFVDECRGKGFRELETEDMEEIGKKLSEIASRYDLPLYTCAERVDLSAYGIQHSSCIDKNKIERITGMRMDLKKDKGQRPECGCVESVDIGVYDTCTHGCKYCYATGTTDSVAKKHEMHDPESPLLIGHLRGDEVITDRKMTTKRDDQLSLFDFM